MQELEKIRQSINCPNEWLTNSRCDSDYESQLNKEKSIFDLIEEIKILSDKISE